MPQSADMASDQNMRGQLHVELLLPILLPIFPRVAQPFMLDFFFFTNDIY